MKFSSQTTYGIRAMISLAKCYPEKSALAMIAKTENISQKYLEQIITNLRNTGLVSSSKGSAGGYTLSKKPNQISLFDIVKALEKNMSVFHCINDSGKIFCSSKCRCSVPKVLVKVQSAINKSLKDQKLSDLI